MQQLLICIRYGMRFRWFSAAQCRVLSNAARAAVLGFMFQVLGEEKNAFVGALVRWFSRSTGSNGVLSFK
jgi:hypothetical protein